MISYIKGLITFKSPTYILVEASGLGYHVNISLQTYSKIEGLSEVKILTFLQIKEDSHTLYGFAEETERNLFQLLLLVTGIGANTARVLLSGMSVEELKSAIISEDLATFGRVKGIGPKTAKRIIIELKDKVMKESGDAPTTWAASAGVAPKALQIREEALSALVALGFNKINVQKILNTILKDKPTTATVEELIKAALRLLS